MRKLILPALALCTALTSCESEPEEKGKDIGALHINKEFPQPGDEIKITYAAEDSIPDSEDEKVKGIINFMTGSNIYPEDIELKDSAMLYTSSIKIPDTATAISFQFKQYNIDQNNNKAGFVLPLYDEEGNPLSGSASQIANFYGLGERYGGVEIAEDSIIARYESDFEKDPSLEQQWALPYVVAIKADKEKASAFVEKQMQAAKENDSLSEDDYSKLSQVNAAIGNKEAADSLRGLIPEKFPKGSLASLSYYQKLYQAQGIDTKEQVFIDYQDKVGKDNVYKSYMLSTLASELTAEGEIDKAQEYASKISEKGRKASAYNSIAWKLVEENKNLDEAQEISKKSLTVLDNIDPKKDKPETQAASQYAANLDYSKAMYQDTYATIMYKKGDLKEAIKYQEMASNSKMADADITEKYIQYLVEDEQYDVAKEKAADFIAENKASEKLKEYYKEAYIASGDASGFEDELAMLEEKGHKKAKSDIKKMMIDEDASNFALKDLDGNEVSLEELKGKTVVLDFWATWCGPCKMSFPGMQKAVVAHKDNPNVEFLFIDTWERQAPDVRMKEVTEFIADNEYDFHVLMDEKLEDSNDFEVVDSYGVSGIPTKFVVGPDGRIKFKSVGWNGNTDKLAEELAIMIQLTQS
ncbi:TlpA family protein disulfide reductase [Zunongwangia sp. SCSIO 43204]|uniref:TlpA disulfide reductase family protein n=1 Tax=Zunongwangia sp. SCSIO 43204 TaxID=2779359 RepID=UPI001CAA3C9E|nr:TlpA disulfide reductase family protein [Zunongwangia sp. SCSIO 43204]UAB84320.1 TlpA family protein disulfide reductase [Zunongwangia sp. SCSIO 43204]